MQEINDISEFEGLKDIWNQVLQNSRDNDVFSTWEWIRCWWQHFGKERKLRILVAKEDNEIIGFAPLMVSKYSFLHLGKFHKLELIGSPDADYNNFVISKKEHECLNLFLKHLSQSSDWDMLEFRDIREGSVSAQVLNKVCGSPDSKLNFEMGTVCPYVTLPESTELFMNSLSANMRRNLRRKMRKLQETYNVEFKDYNKFASVDEAMDTFFDLHQRRWNSIGERGAFASAAFCAFHRDIAKAFSRTGWLALDFLTLDDEPVSVEYSFDYGLKKYGYLTGFNPDFGRYSVGMISKLYVIEESIRKGFREYDFTRGLESYKTSWTAAVRKNFVVRVACKGCFAKMYNWAMQKSFSQLVINKLGVHLGIECC